MFGALVDSYLIVFNGNVKIEMIINDMQLLTLY